MDNIVDWSRCAEHLWARHRILPEWAMEAWGDVFRVVLDPDPTSRSGRSIRVLGHSPSNRCVIAIIGVKFENRLVVASAWIANSTQSNLYLQKKLQNGHEHDQ